MHYVGVDLHRRSAVVTVVDEQGEVLEVKSFACEEQGAIPLSANMSETLTPE